MEKQLARPQSQADQVTADLAGEQTACTAMRDQIRRLQAQIRALERTVVTLRAQLLSAGLAPAPTSEATGPCQLRHPPKDG